MSDLPGGGSVGRRTNSDLSQRQACQPGLLPGPEDPTSEAGWSYEQGSLDRVAGDSGNGPRRL